MSISHQLLKADKRTREARIWDHWMSCGAAYAERYFAEASEDDPFAYNETASVSHLAAAAALAGYLGMAEWSTDKKSRLDRRRKGYGRSDLWLCAEGSTWCFEFKQVRGGSAGPKRLSNGMERAVECVHNLLA